VFLLVVPELNPESIPEARKLAAMAEARGVPFRVVGNKEENRRPVKRALEFLTTGFGTEMSQVVIKRGAAVAEAHERQLPVTAYAPRLPARARDPAAGGGAGGGGGGVRRGRIDPGQLAAAYDVDESELAVLKQWAPQATEVILRAAVPSIRPSPFQPKGRPSARAVSAVAASCGASRAQPR
jgi:hypothetical protein